MRVLFFDVDGVVCTLRSHFAYGDKGGLMEAWDITCCQMIRRLCAKNNIKIVISSTWRKNTRLKILDYYLAMYGLIDHCYKYPDFVTGAERNNLLDEWRTPWLDHVPGKTRGLEIQAWLDKHPEVKHYLIVDDDSDMLEEQRPFHIRTNCDNGFSAENMMDAMKIIEAWDKEDNEKLQ